MTHRASAHSLLVVESCAETLALIREQATIRGVSVLTAPDLRGALAMADMALPDVLVADLCLPEQTGLSLIREFRRRSSQTIIIATAETGDAPTILEAVRAGAADYLHKPVLPEELEIVLDRALGRIPQGLEDVPGIEQLAYRLVLGPNPDYVEPCVGSLIERTAMKLPETQRLHLRATLIELIVNAVEHGSLEILCQEKHEALSTDRFDALITERRRNPRFAKRRIVVQASNDKAHRRLRYTITDEGKGFAWNRFLSGLDHSCDNHNANGRGVFLAKAFFPDLTYNDRGTEVTFSVPLP